MIVLVVTLSEFSTGTVPLACPARAHKKDDKAPAMHTSEPIKFFQFLLIAIKPILFLNIRFKLVKMGIDMASYTTANQFLG